MLARLTPRRLVWPALVASTIFFASMHSAVAEPAINHADKVAHFSVYGLLATLLVRLGRGPRAVWFALLTASLFGATDEWHQYYVPGRSCDVFDWLADTAGAALALALYEFWPWYRRKLETALAPKARMENPPPVTSLAR